MTEFTQELESFTRILLSGYHNSIAMSAGCELFKRFFTRMGEELAHLNFEDFKSILLERGSSFTEVARANEIKAKIVSLAFHFILNDSVVLIHSYSRVVIGLLLKAHSENRRFTVLVTEARPTQNG
jgi:translation initiation factor eIF-2B subunit alpha